MKAKQLSNIVKINQVKKYNEELEETFNRALECANLGMKSMYVFDLSQDTVRELKSLGYIIDPYGKKFHEKNHSMLFWVNPNPWYKRLNNWFHRTFIN